MKVVDGSAGAGKTTVLYGRGDEDARDVQHDCLLNRGYLIIPEKGPKLEQAVSGLRGPQPTGPVDLDMLFRLVVEQELMFYEQFKDQPCFKDRGLPGFETIAHQMGVMLPGAFYDACRHIRYESPIIMLEPVRTFDISSPRPGANSLRVFSLDQRMDQHRKAVQAYRSLGYSVVEVPDMLPTNGTSDQISLRADRILEECGLQPSRANISR
jgi:predicted ATPase